MGPTRVNRKLSFESGEEQIKGYGKVTQNTEIFSRKYGNDILEVGSPEFNLEANRSIFGLLKCLQRFSNMSFLRVHSVLSSNTRDASLDSILSVLGQCVVRSPIWMEPIFNSPLAVAIAAWVLSGKYITLTTTSPLGDHFNLLSEAWWNLPPRECDTRLGTCFCMFSVKASFQVSVTICIGQECDRVQCQIVKLFPVWVSFCLLPPWRFL